MPEFCLARRLGNKPNVVTIEADFPEKANGVLYALGGFSGGLSPLRAGRKDGVLAFEDSNLFELQRTFAPFAQRESSHPGKAKIEVETSLRRRPKAAGPLKVVIKVNSKEAASSDHFLFSARLLFTANDCLDIGTDLGSPVSVDYYDRAPFKFERQDREHARVKYMK